MFYVQPISRQLAEDAEEMLARNMAAQLHFAGLRPGLSGPYNALGRALFHPHSRGLRFALRTVGERQPNAPPSPSARLSKHRSSAEKSSIWGRKKSPIWGMRSGPVRYYNLIVVKPGAP